jgi:hypothetical protein
MPNINDITTAAYRLLHADAVLGGMCSVYRGAKRPSRAKNPIMTVETRHLAPNEGEGMWMCNVVVTAYVKLLADGEPDYVRLEDIDTQVNEILVDVVLELNGAQAFPIFPGGTSGPEWDPAHEGEAYQESTFGLLFVDYR